MPRLSHPERVAKALRGGPRPRSQTLPAFLENRGGFGYEFWLVHGLNYLISGSGPWAPPFPDLYRPGRPDPYPRDRIYRVIIEHFFEEAQGGLSERGIWCVLWAALRPKEMFLLVWCVRRHVRQTTRKRTGKRANPHAQGLAEGREIFAEVGRRMREACPAWDAYQTGDPVGPRFFRGYARAAARRILGDARRKAKEQKRSAQLLPE